MDITKYQKSLEDIPEFFKKDLIFKSKWLKDMNIKVLSFDITSNLLTVRLIPNENAASYRQEYTEDGWNLSHTISAFDKGEYFI